MQVCLRMGEGVVDISHNFDVPGMAFADHVAEHIAFQIGVRRADAGRIVGKTLITDGKDIDGLHMSIGQTPGKYGGIKTLAEIGNIRHGMEIQMNGSVETLQGDQSFHTCTVSGNSIADRNRHRKSESREGRKNAVWTPGFFEN